MITSFSLQGKVAVVTGAASGVGLATVKRFLDAGACVVGADLQKIPLDEHERLRTVRTDVTIEAEIESLMAHAISAPANLDIVVNNAGIGVGAELSATSEALIDTTMNVNARSVMFGIKHGAAKMSDGGSIINTASGARFLGFPTYGAYSASNAAVIMLTKTAAIELGPRRIRANACAPGSVGTIETLLGSL